MVDGIPPGDPILAATMQKMGAADLLDAEDIEMTDWLITALNRDQINVGRGERVVILACGHEVVTRNLHRVKCWKCRFLLLNGYDYEGFRTGSIRDPLYGYWGKVTP